MKEQLTEIGWVIGICIMAVGLILMGTGVLAHFVDKATGENKAEDGKEKSDAQDNK